MMKTKAPMPKTEVSEQAESAETWGGEQRAEDLRAAAIKEVPGMLSVLLGIANDASSAGGPRVAAARSVCELAGQLGPAKELPEPLSDKDISQMSLAELETFISEGQKSLGIKPRPGY
jgi:hypothetical protein